MKQKTRAYVSGLLAIAGIMFALPEIAYAAGLPWEGPLCRIVYSLRTNVAGAVSAAAIVMAGLGYAWGEEKFFKIIMSVVIGVGIATGSVYLLNLFGVGMFGC